MKLINSDTGRYYKLEPVARTIAVLLEQKFDEEACYALDTPKSWLTKIPDLNQYRAFRGELEYIYHQLVDRRWTLDERLKSISDDQIRQSQKVDIWFDKPYCFFVEFDEPKHFSQFRLKTLQKYPAFKNISLDLASYEQLCRQRTVEPGISGFQKVKTCDPLFPAMYPGEKQDNKPRQRAFHDLLADLSASVFNLNPVMRISYAVTNGHIKKFDETDLNSVSRHILDNNFLDKITLKNTCI